MEMYDIVCGVCGNHDFKSVEGKATCQGCGYVLSDNDVENILHQTYEAAMHCDFCNKPLKGDQSKGHWKVQPDGKKICAKCFSQGKHHSKPNEKIPQSKSNRDGECIGVAGGQMSFKYLTNKLPDKDYQTLKIRCWVGMLNDGERPTRWLKPTNKGTSVNFKTIKNREELKNSMKEIQKHIDEVNQTYGTDIKLTVSV